MKPWIDIEHVDKSSPTAIERYAKQAVGMTFRQILELDICPEGITREYGITRYKGGMGALIEERLFNYKANSNPEPDFEDAGVELKTTCFDLKKDGSFTAGERLVLSMIPYNEPIEEDFYKTHLWRKLQDILLIYYCRDKSLSPYDQYIGYVGRFTPSEEDLEIIRQDYDTITGYLKAGRAEDLSESLTTYLAANTKGRNAKDKSPQFYPPHTPAMRRRVYIFGELADRTWDLPDRVMDSGLFAKAFPVLPAVGGRGSFSVDKDPYEVSKTFGRGLTVSPFMNAGAMQNGTVFTAKTFATYEGNRMTLGDLLVPDAEVPAEFFIEEDKIPAWEAGRAAKRIDRVSKSGHPYVYTEGSMPWPDPTDKPARTILTSEGGKGASRMKHAVRGDSGRIRRLVPDELDQIQMFPKGWTNTGMTDGHRAFCMGNALVVGIPHRLGEELAKRL